MIGRTLLFLWLSNRQALSFQDDEGSQAIYSLICHEPGPEEKRLLPPPKLTNLQEGTRRIALVNPSQREQIAAEMGEAEFLAELRESFHSAEDLNSQKDLTNIFQIVKRIFLMSTHALTERYLAEDVYEDVLGMLENDDSLPLDKRIPHRQACWVPVSAYCFKPGHSFARMQCSWWWIFLPCAAANFFSGHLRAPQPWHPHLVHVRDGAAGAAELRRRQEPRAEQEPVPAPLVAFTQLSRCPCPEDWQRAIRNGDPRMLLGYLAPTQRSVSAPARLAPTMPMPAPMRPALAVLRQAEWQLEAQEVGLQQQIVQLREQIREAQVFSPMPGPSLIQAMPPAAPMTNSWQWVPSYGNYGQYELLILQDIVLPRALDDGAFASLQQLIHKNLAAILEHLQKTDAVLTRLMEQVRQQDMQSLLFLEDACRLSRQIVPEQRQALYAKMASAGLFDALAVYFTGDWARGERNTTAGDEVGVRKPWEHPAQHHAVEVLLLHAGGSECPVTG
eukprot:g8580.t1